jgi:hypothetical protein
VQSPPTEPIAPDAKPVHQPQKRTIESAMGAFGNAEYLFTTGLHSGQLAQIRNANGDVLLTYRAFASIAGVIAAFLAAIVAVAGIAGTLLLLSDDAYLRAAIALVLTLTFSFVIALLTPRISVSLHESEVPALTIVQRAIFPSAVYVVATPNGAELAELRKSFLSRLGRNRWRIFHDGRFLGEAREISFFGAMLRKLFGKFSRRFETDVEITSGGIEAGRIQRRERDALVVMSDNLDRRVLVALATLVLGREP